MISMKQAAPTESDEVCEFFDGRTSMQLLQYCKHGDLSQLIQYLVGGAPVGIQEKHVAKIFCCRKDNRFTYIFEPFGPSNS